MMKSKARLTVCLVAASAIGAFCWTAEALPPAKAASGSKKIQASKGAASEKSEPRKAFDVPVDDNRRYRMWTAKGGGALDARLVQTQDGKAVLVLKGGERKEVPIASLSQTDQTYLKLFDPASNIKLPPMKAAPPARTVYLVPATKKDPGVKMELVLVKPGSFSMGDAEFGDAVPHKVYMTVPYYIGKYEVTVAQWKAFAEDSGYKSLSEQDGTYTKGHTWKSTGFEQTPEHPVVDVCWIDMQEFCKWMTTKVGKTVRLPTEAEWEYAAKGPENNKFPWGVRKDKDLEMFNQADASWQKAGQGGNQWSNLGDDGYVYTAPVGSYKSSASWCGAFDMAGNAYEWVQDVYAPYPTGPQVDPLGPASGERRVRRGGSFDVEFYFGICAKRGEHPPHDRRRDEGFRVVMDF